MESERRLHGCEVAGGSRGLTVPSEAPCPSFPVPRWDRLFYCLPQRVNVVFW